MLLLSVALIAVSIRLRARNGELEALNQIGGHLGASLDPEQVLVVLARETSRLFRWDFFFIALASPDRREIRISFLAEQGWKVSQRTLPWGEGLTGRVIMLGESVVWGGEQISGDVPGGEGFEPRSIVVSPLRASGKVIGAISIQSYRSHAYGRSAIRFLETVASKAATAIQNAELYEREQRARRERDEFFSLVTHELKTPLASISGYAELAGRALETGEIISAKQSIRTVVTEARRMAVIAEDVLEAARLDAGRFQLQRTTTNLAEVLVEVVARLGRVSGREIGCEVDDAMPELKLDRSRITQVIENLVSNAIKYSDPEDAVSVSCRREDQCAKLEVRDDGRGIASEALPFIFERFYRAGLSRAAGTGLGLFVTREIVAAHGGTIAVESTLGEGSRFTVRLPLGDASG
jgi:signal transduction histidine kinase